jgi:hypothetical protein
MDTMKNILFGFILPCFAILLLSVACESGENDGQPKYSLDMVEDMRVKTGNLKAEITFRVSDPRTKRVALYWFPDNLDTLWVDIPSVDSQADITARIGPEEEKHIAEGQYRLKAVAWGEGQERSDIYFSEMNIYGEEYAAALSNREAEVVFSAEGMTVTFDKPVNEDEVGVKITYMDGEQTRTLMFDNSELNEPVLIEGVTAETYAAYSSIFLPEDNSLDTFEAPVKKIAGYLKVNVSLNKIATCSDWFMSFTAEKAVDGIKLVDASRWVNNNLYGQNWLEVDLGAIFSIVSYQMFMGAGGAYVGTATPPYQFQAYVNGKWVTLDSMPDSRDAQHSFTFPNSVNATKVRIYIPEGQYPDRIRLYELEVYAMI